MARMTASNHTGKRPMRIDRQLPDFGGKWALELETNQPVKGTANLYFGQHLATCVFV